jgi:hypothetical protein
MLRSKEGKCRSFVASIASAFLGVLISIANAAAEMGRRSFLADLTADEDTVIVSLRQ